MANACINIYKKNFHPKLKIYCLENQFFKKLNFNDFEFEFFL